MLPRNKKRMRTNSRENMPVNVSQRKRIKGITISECIFFILCISSGYAIGYNFGNVILASILSGGVGVVLLLLLRRLATIPIKTQIICASGLIFGMAVATLLSLSLFKISPLITLVLNILFGYLGAELAFRNKEEISNLFLPITSRYQHHTQNSAMATNIKEKRPYQTPLLIDTSVIIDGRIVDICATGFIEGTFLIPRFVLKELQKIADSSDSIKRNRGRRGLEILNKMQKIKDPPIHIVETDFSDIKEVDAKLIKLAKNLHAKIITNDYNLNKIAEIEGIKVLNINELQEALRQLVLPGEELTVQILKEGKEPSQGVGYLEDGTMVVVDKGIDFIGKKVKAEVTSVLQTSAGRIIFTKLEKPPS